MKTMHLKSRRASKRDVLNNAVVLGGLLAALFASPVFADEPAEVSNLVRAGQYAAALGKAGLVWIALSSAARALS